jgi:hypothetical protein
MTGEAAFALRDRAMGLPHGFSRFPMAFQAENISSPDQQCGVSGRMGIVAGKAIPFLEGTVHDRPRGFQLGFIVALITERTPFFPESKRQFGVG